MRSKLNRLPEKCIVLLHRNLNFRQTVKVATFCDDRRAHSLHTLRDVSALFDLLPLPAQYAVQSLCNGTVSVRLSVPAWAHSSKPVAPGLLLSARRESDID